MRRWLALTLLVLATTVVPESAGLADFASCGRADPWTGSDGPGGAERLVRTEGRVLVLDGFTSFAVDDSGQVDATYGQDGRITRAGTIGAGRDGILAWGVERWDEQADQATGVYEVRKADPDGQPVASWAGDGIAEVAPSGADELSLVSVHPLADGRVALHFSRQPLGEPITGEIMMVGASGQLDTGFALDGVWAPGWSIWALRELDDGRIAVVGAGDGSTHLHVLDETGARVGFAAAESFDGPVVGSLSDRVLAAPDGALRVATPASGTWEVATFLPDGRLDSAWGIDGVASFPGIPATAALTEHQDGLVFSWLAASGDQPTLLARRIGHAGAPDTSFADDGTFHTDREVSSNSRVVEPTTGPDGSIYVSYAYALPSRDGATIWRLLPDGQLDSDCTGGVDDPGDGPLALQRIAGTDRYETAAALAGAVWQQSDVVYVATGTDFPDALAGAPAAIAEGAPVLLTNRDRLPEATRTRLVALAPERIVVLGGPVAVSDTVEAQLASIAPVERVDGADRYETAALLATRAAPDGLDLVYLATGAGFADALSAGPVASAKGAAVLLTEPSALPAATREAILSLGASSVVMLGGFAAVGPEVESALRDLGATAGFSVGRLAGFDRYQTMRSLVAQTATFEQTDHVEWSSWNHAIIATGATFPDALAAGAAAGKLGASLVLVPRDRMSEYSRSTLAAGYPRRLTVLGGPAAVSQVVEDDLSVRGLGYQFRAYVKDAFPDRIQDGRVTGQYRDTTVPKRWDTCRPLRWRHNPEGAPDTGFADVTDAVEEIAAASGLEFVYEGTTTARSLEELPADGEQRLVVGWEALADDDAGSALTASRGNTWGYRAQLVLDADGPPGGAYDRRASRATMLHELGHLAGLGHTGSLESIMYPFVGLQEGAPHLSSSDLEGLARLGGC